MYPDPIIQLLRPYIYYEHPAIIFEVPLFENYIEGRLRQFKNHSLYDRLTFLVDTWAIDMAMKDAFKELSEEEQDKCYLENRKRKEYDFEEYDKLYKPNKKKQVKLPDNIKNKKEITIYRGIASKSNKSLEGVLSWTTDLNTAKFFKNRFGNDGERYILVGKCNPKDIEEYYDNEFEVLIDCKYIKNIKRLEEKEINMERLNSIRVSLNNLCDGFGELTYRIEAFCKSDEFKKISGKDRDAYRIANKACIDLLKVWDKLYVAETETKVKKVNKKANSENTNNLPDKFFIIVLQDEGNWGCYSKNNEFDIYETDKESLKNALIFTNIEKAKKKKKEITKSYKLNPGEWINIQMATPLDGTPDMYWTEDVLD